jgi:hypothetical protein
LVVWLASPTARHVSGKLFAAYGEDIELKSAPETLAHLSVGSGVSLSMALCNAAGNSSPMTRLLVSRRCRLASAGSSPCKARDLLWGWALAEAFRSPRHGD